MSEYKYILRDRKAVAVQDPIEWSAWFESAGPTIGERRAKRAKRAKSG